MADLIELAEKAWRGELDTCHEHHPVHTMYEGATELAPGLLGMKGLAGAYAVDTGDGLVLLDAGAWFEADRIYEEVRKWRPDVPVVAAVFSHHHVDHVFAVGCFDREAAEKGWPRPIVYAHELMPGHFERYARTAGWNTAINRRQFAIDIPGFEFPTKFRRPDVLYKDRLTFRRGELTFCLHHGRGETDDHTWTWIPERRILATGDLFIYAVPNAGNPQKVERYVSDWADALDEMAALEPETLLSGHGLPIFGRERISEALTTTAALLRSVEEQALALMNRGCTLDEVVRGVELPKEWLDKPYLRPVYDDPRFLVHMVWRRYGGWWNGEFDELLPAPRGELAAEWVRLAGGIAAVVARVDELIEAGRLELACHLAEAARYAAPDDQSVHEARSRAYRAASAAQTSSMARNILGHAAQASEKGLRDLASAAADGPDAS
ncbi:MAG: MBL fold metallo-hydrolase [Deltaproteobacteria bacterium]|nr:MAG: MBL fold metallo-hydrolase [Deltaproteobacteria bacterium]